MREGTRAAGATVTIDAMGCQREIARQIVGQQADYILAVKEISRRCMRRPRDWGIENQLHWRLDVSMNEDQCRLRIGHGAENFSRLRRIALNKLRRWEIRKDNGKVRTTSLRLKQKACGWSRKFLLEALWA